MFEPKRIYMDYAGAMPVLPEAKRALVKTLALYGNPGSLHREAEDSKEALNTARTAVAKELGVKTHEIIFTSGGTESNNLAILGLFKKKALAGVAPGQMHIVVSAIEHPSVLETVTHLEVMGVRVSRVVPNVHGEIKPDAIAAALLPETILVSVGWANGEIGTVQPISAIAQTIRAYEREHDVQITFHTDLGQAPLYYPPLMHTLGVDLATLDGGKLGSVRGVGVLYVGYGTHIAPLLYGGGQEAGLRPGTENVGLAASFAAALVHCGEWRAREVSRMRALRERCINKLQAVPELHGLVVNGTGKEQMPSILNISIPDVDNEYLTLLLDKAGFAIATKSACTEGERESRVVKMLNQREGWRARNALRLSFGPDTHTVDVDVFVRTIGKSVETMHDQQKEA